MENKKNMKKSFIVLGVACLLIVVGVVLLLTGNNNSFINGNNENGNNVEEGPIDPDDVLVIDDKNKIPFSKSDAMSMVYQEKATQNDQESWYVGDAVILAHNSDNTAFLVHYKKVLDNGSVEELETVATLSDGEKKIEYPGWQLGSKDIASYNFITYEGTEEFDPANHQYSQINIGWDSNSGYTPDPEKGW